MRSSTWTTLVLIALCMHCGCARAEQDGSRPGAPVGADDPVGEDDEPSVWADDLPAEIEKQIDSVVERATGSNSLSASGIEDLGNDILTLPDPGSGVFGEEVDRLLERTPEGSWRALPSVAALLGRLDPGERETALLVLGYLQMSFVDPPGLEEFYLDAYVPLIVRSTYDSSPTVRERACGVLGGVARRCSRRLPFPAPTYVHDRLEELTHDPSPSIFRDAAWALYDAGRSDLLSPELLEEVRKGPQG